MLEVLLLMKEASLGRAGGDDGAAADRAAVRGRRDARGGAGDDGARCSTMPVYREALRAVGDEQEIMIGYSDSNKDVGYLASAWAAYTAQVRLAEVLRRARGELVLLPRPRRRASAAAAAPPTARSSRCRPGTVRGRLKMTEQGEVLTAKYAVPEIAHRELELAASADAGHAALRPARTTSPSASSGCWPRWPRTRRAVYRSIVHDDPDFVRLLRGGHAGATRSAACAWAAGPPSAPQAGGIEDLRAIPWVFCWTQSRIVLPAWLGLGTALRHARERHGLELLRRMAAEWPFFTSVLSNAEMGCAKADLGIARRYVELWDDAARARADLDAAGGGARAHDRGAGAHRRRRAAARRRAGAPGARSTGATRSSTRSRSCRSSCCGGCARGPDGGARAAGPGEPADDQRDRQRPAQHRLSAPRSDRPAGWSSL